MRSALLALLCSLAMPLHAGLDDPTRPPGHRLAVPGGQSAPSWQVNTIRIAEQDRRAVVNGRWVRVGDRVNGARVIDIQPGHVRLRHNQREFEVRLVTARIQKIQH